MSAAVFCIAIALMFWVARALENIASAILQLANAIKYKDLH